MRLISLLFLSILFLGCSQNSQSDIIEVDIDVLCSKDVSILDLFSDVELIALDSSKPISNSVYVGTSNIAFDGQLIYLLDIKSLAVNVYDLFGNRLTSVNKTGRGPGEFLMADQIMYNSDLGLIEILNPMGKILRYEPGTMKFHSELNYMGKELKATHNFCKSAENYILYTATGEDKIWELDAKNIHLSSFSYQPPKYLQNYISAQSPFLEIKGRPCSFRPYDGLIFTFENNEIVPIYQWDLGKYQCRLKDIPRDMNNREYYDFILRFSNRKISPFIDIKCGNNKLFASAIYKGVTHTLYHDIQTGQNAFFETTTENMKFLPELFTEKFMCKFIDCHYLPDFINREILDEDSRKAYDKIVFEDGCGIIKYSY